MANSGRTLPRWTKIYQNGVDLTGETRTVPVFAWDADYNADGALDWEIKGGLCGQESVRLSELNTIMRFDSTPASSPLDIITGWNQGIVYVMEAVGIRAAPMLGDPVGMALQMQKNSAVVQDNANNLSTVTIAYEPGEYDSGGNLLNYAEPWGVLLHPKGAETAASTATGFDGLAATTAGGWMMAQIFSVAGAGSVTIKVQDAAVNANASFADVTGLTTGAIANTAVPCAVIAQTATTATIRQFVRFQISFVGITSCVFALALSRGR